MIKIKAFISCPGLWLFGLCFMPFCLVAQVTINAQIPTGGMMQKEQLWNVSLINNSNEEIPDVNIKLTLQDAVTGQEVLSASTAFILLAKGVKTLSNADLQPILYNYAANNLAGNFLPMGSYIACYQVSYIRGESEQSLSNECVNFNIDPLSPPLLSVPGNKDTVQTPYPLFTWVPPTPVDMFSNLNYDIIISEILDGQSPAEAIDNNTPVYTGNDLMRPNQNYPASFTPLEAGKTYAWQVIAKNGFSYAVKTEVWTFTVIKTPDPATAPIHNFYLLLENNLKDVYRIFNERILIKYSSFDLAHEGAITFSDANSNNIMTINKTIVQGDNYFDITLNHHFKKETIYTVTITDLFGKSHALLFSIK